MVLLGLFVTLAFQVPLSLQYQPEEFMPYKKIRGDSNDVTIIGNTIKCTDPKQTLQECSDECFRKKSLGENCVGFLKSDGTTCNLCETTGAGDHTTVTSGDTLYLLQSEALVPNIYIDMEGIDVGTNTITGIGVSGTISGVQTSDLSQGIKGTSIYLHGGSRLMPEVPESECFCSADQCNGKISLSLWLRPKSTSLQHVITPAILNTGLTVMQHTTINNYYRAPGIHFPLPATPGVVVLNEWMYIVLVVDLDVGGYVYLNGIQNNFHDISSAASHADTTYPTCNRVVIGSKHGTWNSYNANAYIDEIKYFYATISATEVWQEYMADQGLDLTPDLTFTGNDLYTDQMALLVDYNVTSCVTLTQYAASLGFDSKIFNRAADKANFTVVAFTKGLVCNGGNLYVYGGQTEGNQPIDSQFIGLFKELQFVSQVVTGQMYQCRYKSVTSDPWPYVYVKVLRIPSGDVKICDVKFDE